LCGALADVVARHESLRTIFPERLGVPRQEVLAASAAKIELAVTVVSEGELAGALSAAAWAPFDLAREGPLRAHLFALGDREHVLLLVLHHIAGDGWSLVPLLRDLGEFYGARRSGRAAVLPALPVQYADYTLWQREVLGSEEDEGSAIARQLSFWTRRLEGLAEEIALPFDHARPAVSSYRGGSVPLELSAALHGGLLELARSSGASLFMVLQAGLAALLTRLGAGDDIAIGSPIAGRTDSALDDLVGFFVNTLVLRTDTSGAPSFRELIGRVRASNLAAYGHAELPFERLVEVLNPSRSLSRHPLFQVMLTVQDGGEGAVELSGLHASVEGVSNASAKFDLSVSVAERRGGDGAPGGIVGVLEYASDLFERGSVEALADRFVRLLEDALADPERAIGRLAILTPAERHTILAEWNATTRSLPSATLPELFGAQVAKTPDAVAATFEGARLSYGELDARANRLAHHLRALGVGREVVVGLCVERSLAMLVGLLGILKAGGAYLPLDPGYPRERLAFMLSDAGARVLVTQTALRAQLPATDARVVCLDGDEDASAIARCPDGAPASGLASQNAAYVIYTSGSTGTPKGVVIGHHSVVRLVTKPNYVELGPDDVFLHLAPLSFDASTFEIWGALLNGAELVVYPEGVLDIAELRRTIVANGVSVLWLTAALFHQVVDEDVAAIAGGRQLLAGGDVVSALHVRKVAEAQNGRSRLINGYGPTEGTTFSACFTVAGRSEVHESIPIGRPISNTRVYVLDAGLEPVAVGVCGELYI